MGYTNERTNYMDITPFYELKNRLYASAAAGCGSISEDFRLKRAVENFEPLSKDNKALGKLYGLCDSLLKSENPETELPDCIALADALAVTQGTYKDGSETKDALKNDMVIAELHYSELDNLRADIRKTGAELLQLPKEKAGVIKDPRILLAILDSIENGRETLESMLSTNIICRIYGDTFADLLKAGVKNSGKQIKYVKNLRGEKENGWYLSLYENTENSENVRKEAVLALSCSESNTEKLLEIYKTEKGKVKNAAIMALAQLSPKEADPIFAKMAAKYKDSYEEYFSESSGEVCTKFVIDHVMEKFGKNKPVEDIQTNDTPSKLYIQTIANLLHNKTGADADEAYLALRDSAKKKLTAYNLTFTLNYALIYALSNPKKKLQAKAQITRLYEKDSEYFTQAKAFLDITENPEAPIPFDLKTYNLIFAIINQIYYVPILDRYFLQPSLMKYRSVLFSMDFPIGERLPRSMLDFLVKISEYAVEECGKMENSKDEGILKIPNSSSWKVNNRFLNAETYTWNVIYLLKELLNACSPLDREVIENTMKSLALKIAGVCGHELTFSIVTEYCTELTADEIIELHTAYIMNRLKYTGIASDIRQGISVLSPENQLRAVKHLDGEFKKFQEKAKSENLFVSESGFLRLEENIRGALAFLEKPR